MPSPRNAQFIALLVSVSLLLGLPVSQSLRAQTRTPAPAQSTDTAKQKPDFSQEAVVIEDLRTYIALNATAPDNAT